MASVCQALLLAALVVGSALALQSVTSPEESSLAVAAVNSTVHFPSYSQCDPRWANNQMGIAGNGRRSTICAEGCAMTSVAMALAGLGVTIGGQPVNPGSLNTWLQNNQGYVCIANDCNNLNLTAPERLSPRMSLIGEAPKPNFTEISTSIQLGNIVNIAHVQNNSHFVLLVGSILPPLSLFYVNDPLYNKSAYSYYSISDIIRFKVNAYPLYKQCDPAWGSNLMGTNNKTICQVGCFLSSICSAMAGTNILANGQVATPAVVNNFLRANGGYLPGSSALIQTVVVKINPQRMKWPSDGMHRTNDVPFATIKAWLDAPTPRIVIANVRGGGHFVLVVGYRDDGDTLVVNDSGFRRNTYSYSAEVVGWRIFDMH